MKKTLLAAGVMLAALPTAANAQKTQSGTSSNGISWTATSTIVGRTSTATIAGGGDPRYLASADKYRGTVGLVMEYADGSAFVCSGSLLSDRVSILTAGHCVSGGAGTAGPAKVSAFFYDGNASDPVYYADYLFGGASPGVTKVDVGRIEVNPLYTGEVIDQNDVAVLRLASAAPKFANSYELYTGDLTGQQFNVAGYGGRSDTGGSVGQNLGTGRLRQGDNVYDYAWGDSRFNGLFVNSDPECGGAGTNWFCGNADITYSYVSDFDNGLLRNDTGCLVAVFVGGASPRGSYCGGQGAIGNEVGIAGGDSGGPGFIDGKIASVNSYGLSFGAFWGDVDNRLNSSYGEFSGYAPVAPSLGFINFAMSVPEPSTWALMILGFGAVGGAMRRRKAKTSVRFA